ncbi:copper chaperone PCu(A)C [Janthinobacterium sp. NKUCC06_STL]|uniref:copper chaperone PCu(A)C n=1 Tax=Janthinobacterium sp. NKUCC06_STL TaxID=2842127 RepID=UPI001C5AB85B|nr:copper chaperone PCu(A)C [Janthinobacterium sp. NKUCC06_STL]MBW3511307.1 copper chaperone PCu(A)C [Janthinobacterium sp. NKUCC06_STL]
MTHLKTLLATALTVLSFSAIAQTSVQISDPWVRATVPQQKATGAFMQITAPKAMRLLEVRSPVAGVAEIHEMSMTDNMMRMRQVKEIALPAGKAVELKPGGYHVMLLDLKGQVKAGDKIPLTLVVEGEDKRRVTIEVNAVARPLGATPAPMPAMKH